MKRAISRRAWWTIGLLTLAALGFCGLYAPLSTRQGVNFHVTTYHLPLYVKASDFLSRHYHYRALAHEIAGASQSDEERLLTLLAWTREHIRPVPFGWPVIDDHIDHIIIRGYGAQDQAADVFTTLATYAGVPAFWRTVKMGGHGVVLSFARVGGRWVVLDAWRGLVFRNRDGALASLEELLADPSMAQSQTADTQIGGIPYADFLTRLGTVRVPRTLRARLQMPWPRIGYEMRRLLRLERPDGPA